MAHYTDNFNLYEKDPATDGADLFSITTMMNENWDKIDANAQKKLTAGSNININGQVISAVDLVPTSRTINGQALTSNITISTVPSQTGMAGKFLTTDGTTASWGNLTASRAIISNTSGNLAVSDVTSTELSYLDGVTSNIQTQLNNKVSSTAPSVAAPYLKTTYISGTSGYRIWSNGYCEQWGYSSGDGWRTISFTKTFSNTNYFVVFAGCSSNRQTGFGVGMISPGNKTTTSMYVSGFGVETGGLYWKASGYLASGQY